jgi:phosphoribosylamine--glycine ligase
MGAYSPAPVVTDELSARIEQRILIPIVHAMNREDRPYKGVVYAGLMLTDDGPKVLEFNVRFGDPETQPILFRLKSDLVPVLQCVAERNLKSAPALEWDPQPAVCVVIASGGYPGPYEKGKVIAGLGEAATLPDTMVFHAGTALKDGEVVTAGGRVLGVTARGATIQDAKARAYAACERIRFDGAHYRTDIADRAMSHLA